MDGGASASEDGVPFALSTMVPLVVLVSAVVVNVMVVEAGKDVEAGGGRRSQVEIEGDCCVDGAIRRRVADDYKVCEGVGGGHRVGG